MNYIRLASMCALLSLGTFFLFCSFESVLFWKYYKRDTSGATLCHISNSNALVSRHVSISKSGFFLFFFFWPFVVIFKSEILIYRAPATKSNSQKQFPGTIDISGLRDALMAVFFTKSVWRWTFACTSNSDLQPATCKLHPPRITHYSLCSTIFCHSCNSLTSEICK